MRAVGLRRGPLMGLRDPTLARRMRERMATRIALWYRDTRYIYMFVSNQPEVLKH